jgi:hypothetical protein
MATVKERLENNIVLVVLTTAVAAFSAGFGAHAAIAGNNNASSGQPDQTVDWQTTAKEKGWIDKGMCPAMPVVLRVLSPGDNATVQFGLGDLKTDLVISSSQPLPTADSVGFIIKAEEDTNYYVSFPYFNDNESHTLFRDDHFVQIAKKIEKPTHVDMWGIVIDDKRRLGSVYGSMDEIKSVSNTIFLSEKIGITVVPQN